MSSRLSGDAGVNRDIGEDCLAAVRLHPFDSDSADGPRSHIKIAIRMKCRWRLRKQEDNRFGAVRRNSQRVYQTRSGKATNGVESHEVGIADVKLAPHA